MYAWKPALKNFLARRGLGKRRDFELAIPFMVSTFFLALSSIIIVVSLATRSIVVTSPRFYFYCYLFALFSASILILARHRRLSAALLMLGMLEVLLPLSSSTLKAVGVIKYSLYPQNKPYENKARFKYHPLLVATPTPNWKSPSNVNITHNSLGMRGPEPALSKDSTVVYVYGGSTTYDIGVPDGETWPEVLQSDLGSNYSVWNFGVPGYSTAEHVVQTAFYEDPVNQLVCAVYYVGWNDIRNAHIPTLDPGYADFHLLSQFDSLEIRYNTRTSFSPVYRVVMQAMESIVDTVPQAADYRTSTPQSGSDTRLEQIFARNLRTIYAINHSRGIKTIFIPQIINTSAFGSSHRYGWLPLVRDNEVPALLERFNDLMMQVAASLDTPFILVNSRSFAGDDFVDNGHFSAKGSSKFAELIAPSVKEHCHRE